jgi:UDP-N-acetylglucosamine 2-epimerase (non-hydrolysing)
MDKLKLLNVVGARPNFMKIAPLMAAYRAFPRIEPLLVHTGQHYDEKMSDLFFRQLQIPEPEINLGVGGGSQAAQTAAIMTAFEPVVLEHRPDAVLVVGDVNSTVACGIVAVKLGAKLIHVEAGLRSFDRTMPEEINRVLTDSISDLLFCSEQSGVENLRKEGQNGEKVVLAGNVMIDCLLEHRAKAQASRVLEELALAERTYAVVTLHRPSNVDNPQALESILTALEHIQERLKVILPVHPRTRKNISEFGLQPRVKAMPNLQLIEPLGYLEFLRLTASARLVLTDSGGIQEETTVLQIPCLTLRDNTERPVTCEMGTNRLVGSEPARIIKAFDEIMSGPPQRSRIPPLWDGKAAHRIAERIAAASW